MRHTARALQFTVVSAVLLGGAAVAHALIGSDSRDVAPVAAARQPLRLPPQPATFTFVGGGDIALTGDADARVFAGIRRFLRHGDLVVANLEGTLATGGTPRCTYAPELDCFTFRASPAWAATLRSAGFTVLNVANNHALDYGTGRARP